MKQKNLLTSQVYPGTWLDKTEKPLPLSVWYISQFVYFLQIMGYSRKTQTEEKDWGGGVGVGGGGEDMEFLGVLKK